MSLSDDDLSPSYHPFAIRAKGKLLHAVRARQASAVVGRMNICTASMVVEAASKAELIGSTESQSTIPT